MQYERKSLAISQLNWLMEFLFDYISLQVGFPFFSDYTSGYFNDFIERKKNCANENEEAVQPLS